MINLQILGDGIEVNNQLRILIDEKVTQKLEKYLTDFAPDLQNAAVHIKTLSYGGYQTNFDLMLPGKEHIFASSSNENLTSALIELQQEVERQITRYRQNLNKTKP